VTIGPGTIGPGTIGPGTVLGGRYRVGAELGSGGMGIVFRGRDLQLDRDVAIKVMTPRSTPRETDAARFEREARVGAQLSHPHIVQTLDFGSADGVWYLVLQLMTGGDLLAFLTRQQPLPIRTACEISYQVADALAAAHALGVVHRDLKPCNVLLDGRAGLHARIADFGMAYLMEAADPRDGRLTGEGDVVGTPLYMAPEQIASQAVGPPADVYALGCILFELIAGVPPFRGPTAALLVQQLYVPPPRLGAVRPDTPSGLDELVDRMLAKAPSARPSAEAVRYRLAILQGAGAPSRERGGDLASAAEREVRMISMQDMPTETAYPPEPAPGEGAIPLGIEGALDDEAVAALRAAGFEPRAGGAGGGGGGGGGGDGGSPGPAAWVAIGRSPAELARLVATGRPVIAVSPKQDFERVAQLLKAGVAEVVLEPLRPPALIRKIQRALHDRDGSGALKVPKSTKES
jgi:Protein kinase domain